MCLRVVCLTINIFVYQLVHDTLCKYLTSDHQIKQIEALKKVKNIYTIYSWLFEGSVFVYLKGRYFVELVFWTIIAKLSFAKLDFLKKIEILDHVMVFYLILDFETMFLNVVKKELFSWKIIKIQNSGPFFS